jgi:hypothetical protein
MYANQQRKIGVITTLAVASAMVLGMISPSVAGAATSSSANAVVQQAAQSTAPTVSVSCGAPPLSGPINPVMPATVPTRPTPSPAKDTVSGDKNCVTATPTSGIHPNLGVSFGYEIYVHFTHQDLSNTLVTAFVAGFAAAAGVACSAASLGWLTYPCAAVVAFVGALFLNWCSTAYNRGGGLLLDFTYLGSFTGYSYVGNNWT